MKINKIYNENCMDTLKNMPCDFLDLTITSPQYNVNLGKNKFKKNGYDIVVDDKPYEKYLNELEDIFYSIYWKTKPGGRCVINIGDGKNGAISTHSDIIHFMKKIGWENFTTIIWDKKNTSNRAAWGSWLSPSSPSFPRPFEYILVFYKHTKKLQWKGETDLTKEEFIKWSYGLWEFPRSEK